MPRGESLLALAASVLRGVNGLHITPCLTANEAVRRVLHCVTRKIFSHRNDSEICKGRSLFTYQTSGPRAVMLKNDHRQEKKE